MWKFDQHHVYLLVDLVAWLGFEDLSDPLTRIVSVFIFCCVLLTVLGGKIGFSPLSGLLRSKVASFAVSLGYSLCESIWMRVVLPMGVPLDTTENQATEGQLRTQFWLLCLDLFLDRNLFPNFGFTFLSEFVSGAVTMVIKLWSLLLVKLDNLCSSVNVYFSGNYACWGPNASCGKGASGKVAKQAALASVKQTLDRCQKFEAFRESCFNEPVFQNVFRSVSSHLGAAESLDKITEGESTYLYAGTPTRSSEVRDSVNHVSAQNMDTLEKCYSDGFQSVNHVLEESSKVVTLSNKVKKRELLLDDVAGGTVGTSRASSGIGSSLLSGGKGKRSERDREGKSHNREMPSRSGTPKIGRPALGNAKGERKTKTKPKQKTTQLSASVNGLHARVSELPKSVPPSVLKSSGATMDIKTKKKDEFSLDTFNDSEPLDLSHLQIPGIDVLGGPDDLDGQGQDLGSWLNIDDEGFQDDDIMGLEIPMDDLSDLKMML